MEPLDRSASRAIDRRAQQELGLPGDLLMENAGRSVAEWTARLLERGGRRRVVVLAGPGNNGGDGFVAARHLLDTGPDVEVLLLGSRERLRGDAARNAQRLEALGETVREIEDAARVRDAITRQPPPVVVDAVFGTGLDRPVEGWRREALALLEEGDPPVVAVDLPSGLCADTGRRLGVCVRATLTVTFVAEKPGFRLGEGPAHVGEVRVVRIGFPPGRLRRP